MAETPETIVEYRWPSDSGWSRVKVPSSSATVQTQPSQIPGSCHGDTYNVTVRTFRFFFGDCRVGNTDTVISVQGAVGPLRETCQPRPGTGGTRWLVELASLLPDGSVRYWKDVRFGCPCDQAKASPQVVKIVRTSPSTSCPDDACKISIFDAVGKLVFSDVREENCPEWRIDEGCPPDTLECGDCCLDCGDYLGDVSGLVSQVKQLTNKPLAVQ